MLPRVDYIELGDGQVTGNVIDCSAIAGSPGVRGCSHTQFVVLRLETASLPFLGEAV